MTTLSEIAETASKLLNDSENCDAEYNFTRWSKSELIDYAESALYMIAMLYPKKFATCVDIELNAGTVQKLPEGCTTLTKILGTKDSTGAISSVVSSGDDRLGTLFQNVCSGSVNSSAEYVLESYSMEDTSDNIFYVQPPVEPSQEPVIVSAICSRVPDIEADGKFEIQGWQKEMVLEWILYRAYSSEDESTSSDQNAKMHLEHFYTILGNYVNAQQRLINVTTPVSTQNANA